MRGEEEDALRGPRNGLSVGAGVYGPSILPTLNLAGDVVIAEHLSPRLGNLGHGDLVLVRSPLNPNRSLTNCIVAMKGDTVTYFDPLHADAAQVAVMCVLNGLFFVFSY
ncbi:LexA/Signal peptidase-like superfamily [Sesbania bispinosa]|nr:LexA/Signal peptidase-like superfamily [Sesbania bispinosa]